MFKVNNKVVQWRRSGIFIVNFEHISHLALVFLLLTLSKQMPAGLKQLLKSLTFVLDIEQIAFSFQHVAFQTF